MKKIIIRSLIAIVLLAVTVLLILKFVRPQHDVSKEVAIRFQLNSDIAKEFLKQNCDYNQDIVFLADMAIKSRYNRFYVYDVGRPYFERRFGSAWERIKYRNVWRIAV